MDQSSELEKPKRVRVSWKNINMVKTFMEACIHEISINDREGTSLKGTSWKNVAHILKETHDVIVDRKQMKNHYDYLKGKYGAWLLLRNKTGNVYDPSTNTFNLTNDEWESEMKKNKYIEALRNTTLPFPDLCAKLFDGAMSTGVKSWGPSSSEPIPVDEPIVVEDDQVIGIQDTPNPSQPQVEKKKKAKQSVSNVEEEIIGVLKIMAEKHKNHELATHGKNEVPTFDDCLNRLNELGWNQDHDNLYDVALAIFCEPNDHYRLAWMKLQPEKCANWVKMIGRSKGFTW